MIDSLETIAGAHGVGRVQAGGPCVEASRGVRAARGPSGVGGTCDRRRPPARIKSELARVYASGRGWTMVFSIAAGRAGAFTRVVQPRVTGSVRLRFAGGRCEVAGARLANDVRASAATLPPSKVVA